MRLRLSRLLLSLVAAILVAGCVPRVAPPAPAPAPSYTPPPAPPPPTPAPTSSDWRDWPLTPGDWVYRQDGRGSVALFGAAGADAEISLRCDRAAGKIYLSRNGTAPAAGTMTIRTTSTTRALPAQPTGGTPAYLAAALAPSDPLLDAIGFSRGRFIVEHPGMPILVIPAYAEIDRVIEDCRR